MVTSRSIVKRRKESVKTSCNLNEKGTKLKSNLKSEKLSTKKTKDVNTNLEVTQVKDESKNGKPNKVIQKSEEETVEINELATHHSRKKRNCGIKEVKLKDHVDNVNKLKSQDRKNIETGQQMLKQGLKRKRSVNDDKESNKNITSSENATSKTVNLRSLKIRKRRKVDDISKENTDILNLNDLSKEHILQCVSAIFHLTEEQLKNKNALFEGESQPVFMQVTCIRVPKTPQRNMRILLPHSIVSSDDEVALFVGDLQRGRRKDYEPTVEYYEDLLQKHSCTRVKNIIPMNQVKTEYDQHELKRKLVGSYDHFLVDGKIAGHLSHLLGREFYRKRKLPTSIRMQSKDLKHEIEYALKKTAMQLHSFGDTHIVQVGHTSMKEEEIVDNVLVVSSHLSKYYPGGWANIRSIRIKTTTSLALPIYITLKKKNSVEVPVVQPKRPKAYRNVRGKLSTLRSNVYVTVTPEGDVTVKRGKKKKRMDKI